MDSGTGTADIKRTARGRLADRQSARELGRRGGLAKAGHVALSASLGADPTDDSWKAYRSHAEAFRRHHVADLAANVGGGHCGAAPASLVASAALQLAASRYHTDIGEHVTASRLANDSRQNLLAAHELCAREATARARRKPPKRPWDVSE